MRVMSDDPRRFRRVAMGELFSLRVKAVLLLLGAVVVAGLIVYLGFSPRFARTFSEELSKRGNAMVKILEKHQDLRLALSLKDAARAGAVADEVLKGDPDSRYVVLIDAEGKVLGKSAVGMAPGALDAVLEGSFNERDGVQHFLREVMREGEVGGELDFAAEPAPTARRLGKVLLGLSSESANRQLQSQMIVTVTVTAAVLVVAFLFFFTRISSRLRSIGQLAAQIAAGNLIWRGEEDRGRDEISTLSAALTDMATETGAMVGRMQDAAQALAHASAEILTSATQQGGAATRQAASVSETGATVAELRQAFSQASERAQSVIDLAKASEESTHTGRAAVQESVAGMEVIRDHVTTISKAILSLVERTNQIGTMIKTVNELTEQSNVLAVNAAIEAARAGEHGRGFAVVAREVRNLAERSKDSTAQIATILKDIEKASSETFGVIEEGMRKAKLGLEVATRAGQSIAQLGDAISDSSTAAKQIAASTRQQAVGVDQIWQAMREIDRTVNDGAQGIRQLEAASKNMKELSDQMTTLVSRYDVDRSRAGRVAELIKT
jgi:methyl-accepting chemotaxis protein